MSEDELVELPRHCCRTPNLAKNAHEQDKHAIAVEKHSNAMADMGEFAPCSLCTCSCLTGAPANRTAHGAYLSGAQGVGHCGSGGAQAKWLWNSEAGLMLMLTLMLILMMMTKTFSGN